MLRRMPHGWTLGPLFSNTYIVNIGDELKVYQCAYITELGGLASIVKKQKPDSK